MRERKPKPNKPLGGKGYGSIPHLPGSLVGPGDHTISEGQARICFDKPRDGEDRIFVEEKLDGCCALVAKVNGKILALQRRGYLASTSPYKQLQRWAEWVTDREALFNQLLNEGERLVGEWLLQAHGTRYILDRGPWIVFDLIRPRTYRGRGAAFNRAIRDELEERVFNHFPMPGVYAISPISLDKIRPWICAKGFKGFHNALDGPEGVVYRVEREGKVDFVAKWVRPDKVDGKYLPEISGKEAIWNEGKVDGNLLERY